MKFLSRLFGNRREMNLTTALERQRLGRTMPGQTGAVAGARLGFSSNRTSDSLQRRTSIRTRKDVVSLILRIVLSETDSGFRADAAAGSSATLLQDARLHLDRRPGLTAPRRFSFGRC